MTDQQLDLTTDHKQWHRPIDQFDLDVETCSFCSKPLDKEIDEINGIEWVCNNRFCPGK
jgi:hypothetical protein